ncbi:MAG: ribosome silencing factor [Dorea sp.]|jgi:ribosome-associated protein|nr:ribosome silencing factor [Dorea sp.]
MEQGKDMVRIIYDALAEKKGEDIRVIDISSISVMADYFVITNGNSNSQMDALVENVEEQMHKTGHSLKQREGSRGGTWVLLDYGDVIVHIFDKESRSFYNLERIWNDGKAVEM